MRGYPILALLYSDLVTYTAFVGSECTVAHADSELEQCDTRLILLTDAMVLRRESNELLREGDVPLRIDEGKLNSITFAED